MGTPPPKGPWPRLRRVKLWMRGNPLAALLLPKLRPPREPPAAGFEPIDGVHPYSWSRVPAEIRALFTDTIPRAEKQHFMELAIEAALESPFHPTVGAILVREGAVVARGSRDTVWTDEASLRARVRLRHAEEIVLARVPGSLEGATLYTTLEPCCERWTRGGSAGAETCSSALARRGISSVVIGLVDHDPRTRGNGLRHLVAHGVRVEYAFEGLEEALCGLIGNGKFWHAAPEELARPQ